MNKEKPESKIEKLNKRVKELEELEIKLREKDKALEESEQKYRAIFENTGTAMVIVEEDMTISLLNSRFESLSGYKKKEVEGIRKWTEFFLKDDLERMIQYHIQRRINPEDVPKNYECSFIDRNNNVKFIFMTVDVIPGTKKSVLSLQDITKTREEEENYRKLYEEHSVLLEAIPSMIFLISPDLEILWANSVAKDKMKERKAEGKKCFHLFCNSSSVCPECPVARSFSTGKEVNEQLSTGKNEIIEIRVNPIKDKDRNVTSVIVVANDITEKLFLQKEALRTSQLASIGELAAGMAHEINNPITGIINFAELLLDRSEEGSRESYIYRQIIKEGDRIANIIRNLLSFARKEKQEKIPLKIHRVFSNTLSLTGTGIAKNNINIKVNIPPDLPEVIAQPGQMQHVFMNILGNSQYGLNKRYPEPDENKIIEVTARELIIKDNIYVEISIKDNGCGISADIIDKVMNPFFTARPPGEGTGLGLSISYGIISDHGGDIIIESKEGEFTEVKIRLPAWEEDV